MNLNSLSQYTRDDTEKMDLIDDILSSQKFHLSAPVFYSEKSYETDSDECCLNEAEIIEEPTKVCPKCGRKYPGHENFCLDCSLKLKDIGEVNIKEIDVCHEFEFKKSNTFTDFKDILTPDNLIKINEFNFKMSDLNGIIKNIKSTAIRNLDNAIKDNDIDLDNLTILEKVMLFVKAFVDVEYKSSGGELGYYSFNSIFVDDRQLDSLQITTMLHELTHFLNKEILTQIACSLLDASKTREMESIIAFALTYSKENCLIDEYAAHTVEGRFTLFGYQDYSSFLNIQKSIDRPDEEIEMLKTIGNTFADIAKGIVEAFIDDDLLREIKDQFRRDILDDPNYSQLALESCTLLNTEGLFGAVQFILLDGFVTASENLNKLYEINDMW